MPKAGFEPRILVKLEETLSISSKHSWVHDDNLFKEKSSNIFLISNKQSSDWTKFVNEIPL